MLVFLVILLYFGYLLSSFFLEIVFKLFVCFLIELMSTSALSF